MDKRLSVVESLFLTVFNVRQNGLWPLDDRKKKKKSHSSFSKHGAITFPSNVYQSQGLCEPRGSGPIQWTRENRVGLKISSAGLHRHLCLQNLLNG